MENASNALRIAGGVLIGVLVLTLLVAGYYNLRSYIVVEETEKNQGQVLEFNKQYYAYIKDVYGSEILSLANKTYDYNLREAQDKGYSRLDVYVTFTKNHYKTYSGVAYGFKKKKYTTDEIVENMSLLTSKIEEFGNKKYNNYEISKLALMRTNEQEGILEKGTLTEAQKEAARKYINYYITLKSIETEIKSKVFQYIKVEYDNTTGRIKSLEYKEK